MKFEIKQGFFQVNIMVVNTMSFYGQFSLENKSEINCNCNVREFTQESVSIATF